jgi:RHS repeat-associated protein
VIYYTYTQNSLQSFYRGQKRYELNNHLGNVLAVITDRRIQACGAGDVMHYEAQVVSVSDYYPFGMGIKEREWKDSSFGYRFGFNGKEQDNSVKGQGNSYDFGARIYDSRLGRWMSVDPLMKKYPEFTPYCFAIDNPIYFVDYDGRDIIPGRGWEGSEYENLWAKYTSQNNAEFMKIFCLYDNNGNTRDLALTFSSQAQQPVFKTHKILGHTFKNSSIKSRIEMNSSFGATTVGTFRDVNMSYVLGTDIYFKYELNNIGRSIGMFHEMIHAQINNDPNMQTIPSSNETHHPIMSESKYQAAMTGFLTQASSDNGWNLSGEQIEALSYYGIHKTENFQDYIASRANLPDDYKSATGENKIEYSKQYKKAWYEWKTEVDNMMNNKTYMDVKGAVIGQTTEDQTAAVTIDAGYEKE